MDNATKEEVKRTIRKADLCRKRLAESRQILKTQFAKLREDFEKHISSMERQTTHKLEELTAEQTKRIKLAEAEVKERLTTQSESNKLKSALKHLSIISDACLEFEVSPDLDRLRFLSEFGILRLKASPTCDKDQECEGVGRLNKAKSALEQIPNHTRGSAAVDVPYTGTGDRYSHTDSYDSETSGEPDIELTTDSGFIHVSTYHEKDLYCSQPLSNSQKQEAEMTSPESDKFITTSDGKIIAFSATDGYVKLLSNKLHVLSKLQIKYPKAICCLKKNSVLLVVHTPLHDEIWVMKVTGNELIKVNAFRIKCHDRICDISYKGSSLYVMCSGNHLHMVDTLTDTLIN